MPTLYKILIIYANSGAGHRRAAEALFQEVKTAYPAARIEILDALDLATPFFRKIYPWTYLFLVKYLPWLWALGYYFLNLDSVARISKIVRRINNALCCKGFEQYLLEQQPDLVFTTHFLPNEIITHLKKKHGLKTILATCITDYYPHAWWREQGVDLYITPNEELTARLETLGVAGQKIQPLGIPINQEFGEVLPKEEIRARLGLRVDQFTLLVTSGGFGVGPVKTLLHEVLQIKTPLQIMVICGNNQKLQEELRSLVGAGIHTVHIYGFVRNMHELMNASDLMVSKSGGLTTTEAMAKGLPMVVLAPIPGQESGNCEFLLRHNACLRARDPREAAAQIEELVRDAARLQILKKKIAELGRPHASKEIVRYVATTFLKNRSEL